MCTKVAISQRVVQADEYVDPRDALSQDWAKYFAHSLPDAVLLAVPNQLETLGIWLSVVRPDFVVLSNGDNWGEVPERDQVEISLIEYAVKRKIPILGVCRGWQVLNIHFGGGVVPVGGAQRDHVSNDHSVNIVGQPFIELAGTSSTGVNSFHDYGVTHSQLSSDFEPFAVADDGVIEGAVHFEFPVLAIQWHPERSGDMIAFGTKLMRELVSSGIFWRPSK